MITRYVRAPPSFVQVQQQYVVVVPVDSAGCRLPAIVVPTESLCTHAINQCDNVRSK